MAASGITVRGTIAGTSGADLLIRAPGGQLIRVPAGAVLRRTTVDGGAVLELAPDAQLVVWPADVPGVGGVVSSEIFGRLVDLDPTLMPVEGGNCNCNCSGGNCNCNCNCNTIGQGSSVESTVRLRRPL